MQFCRKKCMFRFTRSMRKQVLIRQGLSRTPHGALLIHSESSSRYWLAAAGISLCSDESMMNLSRLIRHCAVWSHPNSEVTGWSDWQVFNKIWAWILGLDEIFHFLFLKWSFSTTEQRTARFRLTWVIKKILTCTLTHAHWNSTDMLGRELFTW